MTAKRAFPYAVECKNAEQNIGLYKNFKQAKRHNHREPLLVIKKNREPALAIITLDHFFELIEKMIDQATRTYQTFLRPPPLPDHIVINKTSELVELIDIPFSTLEKSVKYFVSVQNGDHPNSVAKVIMDDKKVKRN